MKPPSYGSESGQGGPAVQDVWARRQETAEVAGFCHGLDIQF